MSAERAMRDLYGEDYPLAGLIAQLGQDLREIREKAQMTQRELAAEIGTNQMQIYNIEQGRRLGAHLKSYVQYADALGYKMVIAFVPVDEADHRAADPDHSQANENP